MAEIQQAQIAGSYAATAKRDDGTIDFVMTGGMLVDLTPQRVYERLMGMARYIAAKFPEDVDTTVPLAPVVRGQPVQMQG